MRMHAGYYQVSAASLNNLPAYIFWSLLESCPALDFVYLFSYCLSELFTVALIKKSTVAIKVTTTSD